jgi:predicted TPR repeat methyltransferase
MSKTNQLTIDAYNKSVDEYIKGTPQKVDGHIQTWLDKCITLLKSPAKILEIGVGRGKDADYLESKGFMVDRTDASESFVDFQKQNGHDARVLNILTDGIDSQYDMILADAVWLHFNPEEAKLASKKVRDALTNDGFFAFSVKQGDGEELTDRKLNSTRYFCYWQEAEIRLLLEETGFHDNDIFHATDYRPDRPGWLLIIAKK